MTKKTKKPVKIKAWSYSRLDCYESCPLLFKYRNIDKLDEPKAQPMLRGIKIHNQAAAFLGGSTNVFPPSCQEFYDDFHELKELDPIIEQKWAFTKKWKSTNYFNPLVYLRVTLDALVIYKDGTADMIDHKTGKFHEDSPAYEDQKILFGAAVMKKFPQVHHVTARLWFLDAGEETITEIFRGKAAEGLADLEARAAVMIAATRWPAKPSWKCGGVKRDGTVWGCHFRKSNGGPCKHG